MQLRKETKAKELHILFCVAPFMAGLYYELTCAAFSLALIAWLWKYAKGAAITLRWNTAAASVLLFFAAYLITPFWAVDRGMAVWGIAKALPLPLFSLCIMQISKEERDAMLHSLPMIGCIMTVVSCVLCIVPSLETFFIINGRLGGFFQYPNTFACFLLLGIENLIFDEQIVKWKRYVQMIVLVTGLLQAGSRAVFLLALVSVLLAVLYRKNGEVLLSALMGSVGGLIASVLFSILKEQAPMEHMLDISADASTFLGRLLYWKDALPVIAKKPFGLGYLGYYFSQGTFQTGVYSVRWIHNDLLQFLLDVGWIPVILCLIALWKALRSGTILIWQKIILLTLLLHAACDFDLEYTAMFFILLLNLDWDNGKQYQIKYIRISGIAAIIATALSLWIGLSSTLTVLGKDLAAVRIYPGNTFSQLHLLTEDTDMVTFAERSTHIIRQNSYSAVAWNARAIVAQQQGDYSAVVYAKRKAISCNKYDLTEYTDYIDKLLAGAAQYNRSGQPENARLCIEEAKRVPLYLTDVQANTSTLAWRIADKPQLELPQEYLDRLAALTNEGSML